MPRPPEWDSNSTSHWSHRTRVTEIRINFPYTSHHPCRDDRLSWLSREEFCYLQDPTNKDFRSKLSQCVAIFKRPWLSPADKLDEICLQDRGHPTGSTPHESPTWQNSWFQEMRELERTAGERFWCRSHENPPCARDYLPTDLWLTHPLQNPQFESEKNSANFKAFLASSH